MLAYIHKYKRVKERERERERMSVSESRPVRSEQHKRFLVIYVLMCLYLRCPEIKTYRYLFIPIGEVINPVVQ